MLLNDLRRGFWILLDNAKVKETCIVSYVICLFYSFAYRIIGFFNAGSKGDLLLWLFDYTNPVISSARDVFAGRLRVDVH